MLVRKWVSWHCLAYKVEAVAAMAHSACDTLKTATIEACSVAKHQSMFYLDAVLMHLGCSQC